MKQDERFGHAAGMLGERVRQVLERISPGIGGTVSEIRLRVGQPLGLTASAHPLFVDERGGVFSQPPADGFRIRRQDLQDCLVSLCGWAVHSHQREMASGYISVKGGHRGNCGGRGRKTDSGPGCHFHQPEGSAGNLWCGRSNYKKGTCRSIWWDFAGRGTGQR